MPAIGVRTPAPGARRRFEAPPREALQLPTSRWMVLTRASCGRAGVPCLSLTPKGSVAAGYRKARPPYLSRHATDASGVPCPAPSTTTAADYSTAGLVPYLVGRSLPAAARHVAGVWGRHGVSEHQRSAPVSSPPVGVFSSQTSRSDMVPCRFPGGSHDNRVRTRPTTATVEPVRGPRCIPTARTRKINRLAPTAGPAR